MDKRDAIIPLQANSGDSDGCHAKLATTVEELDIEPVVKAVVEQLIDLQVEDGAEELARGNGKDDVKPVELVVKMEETKIEEKVQSQEESAVSTPVPFDDLPQQHPVDTSSMPNQLQLQQPPATTTTPALNKETTKGGQAEKKKEDDKQGIYKALAIKLKKELVKSREELQKIKAESGAEVLALNNKVQELETQLGNERQLSATTIATLEARVKSLQQQLDSTETELRSMQIDFENYKVQASKIIQKSSTSLQSQANKTIEEDRFKQLKQLNDEQQKRIVSLNTQLSSLLDRNRELEEETKRFQEQLSSYQAKVAKVESLESKCGTLSLENENLKTALKQYRSKLKEPLKEPGNVFSCDESRKEVYENVLVGSQTSDMMDTDTSAASRQQQTTTAAHRTSDTKSSAVEESYLEDNQARGSPSASVRDGSQTTSSSSFDGSTSGGYVHIKPNTFEIISRSSVLEDAQNQIDNLTKAYLESENTNSLLSEQVKVLKEEIRRLQLVTERIELADNLEYLKNIVFKFLSLDSNQTKQKERLIPVLSTVLKLSPEETAKLNSVTMADKGSMLTASSFFKL